MRSTLQISCWGSGRLNVSRASDASLAEVARLLADDQVVESLLEQRRTTGKLDVKGFMRDRVVVRYTDLGFKIPDQKLERDRVGVLAGGLTPGAYAVHRTEREARHVLLVSEATHPGGKRMWLTLGYSGEARLVESAALTGLPWVLR